MAFPGSGSGALIDVTDDLVVALPTSAGKTRIAELCILRTLADERRVIYVTPLRVSRHRSNTASPVPFDRWVSP